MWAPHRAVQFEEKKEKRAGVRHAQKALVTINQEWESDGRERAQQHIVLSAQPLPLVPQVCGRVGDGIGEKSCVERERSCDDGRVGCVIDWTSESFTSPRLSAISEPECDAFVEGAPLTFDVRCRATVTGL